MKQRIAITEPLEATSDPTAPAMMGYEVEQTQRIGGTFSVPYDYQGRGLTRHDPIPHDYTLPSLEPGFRAALDRMTAGFDVDDAPHVALLEPVYEERWVRFPARRSIFAALFGRDVVTEWGVEERKVVVAERWVVTAEVWPSSRVM